MATVRLCLRTMFKSLVLIAPSALFLAAAGGCSKQSPISDFKAVAGTATNTELRIFEMRGTVKRVDVTGKRVLIAHDEVKDFMAAMTMPFQVREDAELRGLIPEDEVSFRLSFSPATNWIDHIEILGGPRPEKGPDRPPVRVAPNVEPLKVGDPMPSYSFTNEFGAAVNLANLNGTAFAVTFIYTRCPFPDFCPKMSARFAETMKLLQADRSAPTNWHLFSLTFDPTYDTPRILRNYGRQYGYDPAAWSFLTGSMYDIDGITDQIEMQIMTGDSASAWSHRLRTIVVDANGKLQSIFRGGNDDSLWRTQDLVDALVKAARVPPAARN